MGTIISSYLYKSDEKDVESNEFFLSDIEYNLSDSDCDSDESVFNCLNIDSSGLKDFVLKYPINTSKLLYESFNTMYKNKYNKKKITVEYLTSEQALNYIKILINFFIDVSNNFNYSPLVLTITIQLLLRIFEKEKIPKSKLKYIFLVCFNLSLHLEYDNCKNLKTLYDMSLLFNMSYKKLLRIEVKILKILNNDLIYDTIFHYLTVEKREELINDSYKRNLYYIFISDINIYTNTSEQNCVNFLKL